MDFYTRKAIFAQLKDYCHLAKKDSFMEVTEWKNGEGWDISIDNKQFSLTHGELQLLIILTSIKHE